MKQIDKESPGSNKQRLDQNYGKQKVKSEQEISDLKKEKEENGPTIKIRKPKKTGNFLKEAKKASMDCINEVNSPNLKEDIREDIYTPRSAQNYESPVLKSIKNLKIMNDLHLQSCSNDKRKDESQSVRNLELNSIDGSENENSDFGNIVFENAKNVRREILPSSFIKSMSFNGFSSNMNNLNPDLSNASNDLDSQCKIGVKSKFASKRVNRGK